MPTLVDGGMFKIIGVNTAGVLTLDTTNSGKEVNYPSVSVANNSSTDTVVTIRDHDVDNQHTFDQTKWRAEELKNHLPAKLGH
ncbi:hypothetical protein H0H92_008972 [Tricholoma furcatifolium]|nr:hypothetical protein H0H92_008972 [Tricholoma furcatifolium]